MNRLLLFSILLVLFIYYGGKNVPKVMKNNKEILLGIVGGLVLCSFLGMNLEGYCTIGPDITQGESIEPNQPTLCFDKCPDGETWSNLEKCLDYSASGATATDSAYNSSACTDLEADPLFGIYKKIREQQQISGPGQAEQKFFVGWGSEDQTCKGLAQNYNMHKRMRGGAAQVLTAEDATAADHLLCRIPGWEAGAGVEGHYFNYEAAGWIAGEPGATGFGPIFPKTGNPRSGSPSPLDASDRNLSCNPLLPNMWLWRDNDLPAQNSLMMDSSQWATVAPATVPAPPLPVVDPAPPPPVADPAPPRPPAAGPPPPSPPPSPPSPTTRHCHHPPRSGTTEYILEDDRAYCECVGTRAGSTEAQVVGDQCDPNTGRSESGEGGEGTCVSVSSRHTHTPIFWSTPICKNGTIGRICTDHHSNDANIGCDVEGGEPDPTIACVPATAGGAPSRCDNCGAGKQRDPANATGCAFMSVAEAQLAQLSAPQVVMEPQVHGCTNISATNYNRDATVDDDSCVNALMSPEAAYASLWNALERYTTPHAPGTHHPQPEWVNDMCSNLNDRHKTDVANVAVLPGEKDICVFTAGPTDGEDPTAPLQAYLRQCGGPERIITGNSDTATFIRDVRGVPDGTAITMDDFIDKGYGGGRAWHEFPLNPDTANPGCGVKGEYRTQQSLPMWCRDYASPSRENLGCVFVDALQEDHDSAHSGQH